MSDDMRERALPNTKSIAVDYVSRQVEVVGRDGRRVTIPYDGPEGIDAERSSFDLDASTVAVQFPGLPPVVAEIGGSGTDADLLRSRPVVYLDQNHWITLADRMHKPDSVDPRLWASADKLIDLARAEQIVLPLSSGHFVESTITDGERRKSLAKGMLGLSRGWQMMHPMKVRRQELLALMQEGFPEAAPQPGPSPVITLEPDALWGSPVETDRDPELPPELADLWHRITAVLATYSTLADPHAEQRIESQSAWVEIHQRMSAEFAKLPKNGTKRAAILKAWMLRDLQEDIAFNAATLQLGVDEFWAWMEREFDQMLLRRPYVGLVFETTRQRLTDTTSKWERNDLIDMHYLCCAAGYADLVVGEKKFTAYLNRSLRRCNIATPCERTLDAAVERINDLLSGAK